MITYREYCKRLNERKSKGCTIREDWGTTSPIPEEVYEFPKEVAHTKGELKALIQERIERDGVNADLNDIDVSNITDMGALFFNSLFNGDISKWNISNVTDMGYMFYKSDFSGDISGWDVGNVRDMAAMFKGSPLEKNPPKWYKK